MQRSEGNEASFFLRSSLPKGVERRRRGGEEERKKKTRHACASREKAGIQPFSLFLVAIQFLCSSPRETQVCETWPSLSQPGRFPALSNIFLHRVDDELKEGKKLANYFPDRVNKRNVKSYVEARPVIFPGLGLFCLERELLIR